jgi:hypothetical protein
VRAGYAHSLTLAPLFCGAILARRRRRLSPTETRKRARR